MTNKNITKVLFYIKKIIIIKIKQKNCKFPLTIEMADSWK